MELSPNAMDAIRKLQELDARSAEIDASAAETGKRVEEILERDPNNPEAMRLAMLSTMSQNIGLLHKRLSLVEQAVIGLADAVTAAGRQPDD